ncbi:hypothetical protein BLNAU_8037 [Blattamonas nauphoetae]|uniref:Uncharacterized protein n=1 Tax=Blattamonas nauphoetae TaxID=2049346 RepID=A0ABQ9XZN7_9EUKA|nr:hypothetical protein BLNAU_8037 [Blattamonas nauphoetae]
MCQSWLSKHSPHDAMPSGSTDSSSELVSFVGRLCSTLAERVSEMKSLFTESSPSDGTVSALSTTLPDESPLLIGNTILIKLNFVHLLKSTIIASLDLLEPQKIESNSHPADQTDMLINILNISWNYTASCLYVNSSLRPLVESTFSDVPQLCSLLERTCCHSSPTHFSHLGMFVNIGTYTPHLIPRLLEENLVKRVIDTTKPMAVPVSHGEFHLDLIWTIVNLIWDPSDITQNQEDKKRIRMLQFERVLKPAKQYLQFILQREEFIPTDGPRGKNLPFQISNLLEQTLALERKLLEDGEMVETGREEWEVGWLVEKTNEFYLGQRLKRIRGDDVEMKMNEKARWKKRVERLREAGHEDAMEGWLTRRSYKTPEEIEE